jgi:uncharacterized protein GlcG (DUF336 family)
MSVSVKRLSLETVQRIAQGSIEACRKKGIQIGVTVVDRHGITQITLRDTLASPLTLDASYKKAYTAAAFGSATSSMAKRFTHPFSIAKLDNLVMSAGGLPIEAAGVMYGAVGVSGASTGELDEACAKAGLEPVLADLEMADF